MRPWLMVMALSPALSHYIIYKHAGKPTLTGGHAVADLLRADRKTQTEPTHYYSLLRVMAHYITLSFFILFLIRRHRHCGVLRGPNMGRATQKHTRAPTHTWRLNARTIPAPEWHKYLWTPGRMSLFLKYSNAARAEFTCKFGLFAPRSVTFLQSLQEK